MLTHDLVDELHLLLYPLTLGSGKRLFTAGPHTRFTLKHTTLPHRRRGSALGARDVR